MKFSIAAILLFPLFVNAQNNKPTIPQQVFALTEVMYHDVVNPPAAARFYAYSLLGGYEVLYQLDPTIPRIGQLFSNYPRKNYNALNVNSSLAVMYGILETGKNIIPSGALLEEKQQSLIEYYTTTLPKDIVDSSVLFAKRVVADIITYSKTDNYFKLSTLPRYRPVSGKAMWKPTPPEYMSAVEPHWKTIRTFFLDSCDQFIPKNAEPFEEGKGSNFYALMNEVYEVSNNLTPEQKLIANFWDCNPFAVQFQGHMSIGLKKISPGGHWMGITGIASEKANLDFTKTMLLHTIVALTLHDAFISCWDEKYRSNRLRPETAINQSLDQKWKPLLQTPPFPEYPSGHSVISTAASEVLTFFISDNFSFSDTIETYIGLPARDFNSFREAAAEARISRLYGGIHFRDAIERGGEQGRLIGEFIIRKLKPVVKLE